MKPIAALCIVCLMVLATAESGVSEKVEGAPGADERTRSAASNDATLSNLSLGDEITFTPSFQARVGSYTATIAYRRVRITLRAEGPDRALLEVTGETADGTPIKLGTHSRIGSPPLNAEEKGSRARWTFSEVPVGRNMFAVAVTSGDGKATQTYTVTVVRRGPDMDIEEDRDLYFLESVKDGDADGVASAIEAGVKVTKQLEFGRQRISAVALASFKGYEEVVRILIRAGADVNQAVPASKRGSAAGMSPLILAVNNRSEEMVRLLIEAGADVSYQIPASIRRSTVGISPLILAVNNRSVEMARLLIEAGADVNYQVPASIRGSTVGISPLILAVNNRSEEIVRLLIEAGADVNYQAPASIKGSAVGISPLILAVNNRSEEMVRLMIEAGADVNYQVPGKRRRGFRTALGMAKAQKNRGIVRLLRDAGAKER